MWIRLAWDEKVHLKMWDTSSRIESTPESKQHFLLNVHCAVNWCSILTVVCPRSAQLARARRCGRASQWPRLTASHAPGLLAQQRVEEVGQHPLTRRGGAGLHSGGVNLKIHILENTKPDLIFTTLKHLLTSVWRQISIKSVMQAKSKVKAVQRRNKSFVLSCLTISTADVKWGDLSLTPCLHWKEKYFRENVQVDALMQ